MYQFLASIIVFFFGLCIGSFLDAVIDRMAEGKSVLQGRSYCPFCKHQLAWPDLIPLLSFVLLGRKCRYCKKSISWQYPAVEILTGAIFLLIFNFQFLIFNEFSSSNFQIFFLLYLLFIASALVILFVYDFKYYVIPDAIVYLLIGATSVYRIFEFLNLNHWNLIENWKLKIENLGSLENALFSAFFAALFFFSIWAISKGRWMGFGDVKLAFFMGLFLGFPGIIVALFVAFFAGALIGIVLIATKKKHMRSEVPFGPFLIGGTFLALLWGQAIFDWYLHFLLV